MSSPFRSALPVLVAVLVLASRLPAQESRAATELDRERVREAVLREDWKGACAICAEAMRTMSLAERRWWDHVAGACYVPQGYPQKNAPQTRMQAWAFELVGLHSQALDRYRRSLEEAKTDQDTATEFASMARCAIRLEDLPECLAALEGMERNSTTWMIDKARKEHTLVAALAKAPRDVEARIRFASEYWVRGNNDADDFTDPCAAVTAFLSRTLDYGPTPDQSLRILGSVFHWNLYTARPDEAIRWARKLRAEHGGSAASHQAAVGMARHFLQAKVLDEAERWARQVVLAKNETPWTASAYLVLADLDEVRGRREAMGKNLLLAVESSRRADPFAYPADASRQTALMKLGRWHRDRGEFERAMDCFKEWRGPSFTCGLGHVEARDTKVLAMAETLVAAGRPDEALKDWIDPMLRNDVGCCRYGGNPSIARLAVMIHQRRGTLDQLVKQCESIPAHEHTYTSDVTLGLAKIRLAVPKPDAKALVSDLLAGPPSSGMDPSPEGHSWRERAICDELRAVPGPALQEIRERHAALMRTPPRYDDELGRHRVRWLYAAAILLDSPESRAWIAGLEAAAREALPTDLRRTEHDDVLIAVQALAKTK